MFFEDDHHQAWLVFDGCLRLTCPTYTVTPNHSYIQQCSGKLVYINVNTNLDPEFEIKWRKKKHTPSSLSSTFESFFIVLLRRNPSLLSREHNTVMKNLEKGSHSTRLWAKVNWLHFFFFPFFFEKIEIRHFLFIFRQHDASIKVFIYPAAVLTEAQSCKA